MCLQGIKVLLKSGFIKIWGRWSDIVEVKLPDMILVLAQLEYMLSISVSDLSVIL